MLDEWLLLCPEDYEITSQSRVCSLHFNVQQYYAGSKGRLVLKKDAVPSLETPTKQRKHSDSAQPQNRRNMHGRRKNWEIWRKNTSRFIKNQHPYLTPTARELYNNEVRNIGKDKNRKVYNEHIKQFALKQAYFSRAGYEHLRSIFTLPAPQTLNTCLSKISCNDGFLQNTIDMIGERISVEAYHPEAVLLLNEMSLHEGTKRYEQAIKCSIWHMHINTSLTTISWDPGKRLLRSRQCRTGSRKTR